MTTRWKALAVLVVAIAATSVVVGTAAAEEHIGEFVSAKYPETFAGTQTNTHTFVTKAGTWECATAKFSGSLTAATKETSVTPSYSCTLGKEAATVAMNGCTYTLKTGFEKSGGHFEGSMNIACPKGAEITFTQTSTGCEMRIPAATNLGELEYVTFGGSHFNTKFIVETFAYSLNGKCVKALSGNYTDGKYFGETEVKGSKNVVVVS